LLILSLALPGALHQARSFGEERNRCSQRVERTLRSGAVDSLVIDQIIPGLHPDRWRVGEALKMLRAAGIGSFKRLQPSRVAVAGGPEAAPSAPIRR
jgi:hypothetical protein